MNGIEIFSAIFMTSGLSLYVLHKHKEKSRIKGYKHLYNEIKNNYSEYRLVLHEYDNNYYIQQLQDGKGWINYSHYKQGIDGSCPEEFFVETMHRIKRKSETYDKYIEVQ